MFWDWRGSRGLKDVGLLSSMALVLCAPISAHPPGMVTPRDAHREHSPLDLSVPQIARREALASPLPLDAMRPTDANRSRVDSLQRDPSTDVASGIGFPIHWQRETEWVRAARNFRHSGLSVVRLWASGRSSLVIGVNPHGVPGVYFSRGDPDRNGASTDFRNAAGRPGRVSMQRSSAK